MNMETSKNYRWQSCSDDPNHPEVYRSRKELIAGLISERRVLSRTAFLVEAARGKRFLDVGVVEHSRDAYETNRWLHRHIRDASASCLGVDVLGSEVAFLTSQGFDVIEHDFCEEGIPGQYEVVVCGDVLEHVVDPGRFLRNLRESMTPDGRLIVTVPNPWYVNSVIKNIWGNRIYVDSADHVAWHDYHTMLELGLRSGLLLEVIQGVFVSNKRTAASRWLSATAPLAVKLGFKELFFCKTVIFEFSKGELNHGA